MRFKLSIATAAALLVIALVAGGIYWAADFPQEGGTPEALPAATATASERGFAFTALETPRELPELHFVNGDGREMTLEDFEGRTILLNIWATWCVPCREAVSYTHLTLPTIYSV